MFKPNLNKTVSLLSCPFCPYGSRMMLYVYMYVPATL